MTGFAIGSATNEGWSHRISAGVVTGHRGLSKFGRNSAMTVAGVDETVWDGSSIYTWPTTSTVVGIVSDNAADTMTTGAGAWSVHVYGLADDGTLLDEVKPLDGANPVATTGVFSRVFRVLVEAAGSSLTNAGTITMSIGGGTVAQILPGNAQTQMAIYSVSVTEQFYLSCYYFALNRGNVTGATPQANIELRIRESADVATSPWRVRHVMGIALNGGIPNEHCFDPPLLIPSRSDIEIRAVDTNVTDVDISAGFNGVLETI